VFTTCFFIFCLINTQDEETTIGNMSQQPSTTNPPSYSSDSAGHNSDDSSNSSDTYVQPTVTATEAFYIHHHQSLKYLVVLCEGLKREDDNALLDPQKEPFSSYREHLPFELDRQWRDPFEATHTKL
jgi:hypothetical protein